MEKRTYYMVLGVTRNEGPQGIRAAYRELARKLHPDVAGVQATPAFQEISEAYGVLSDPDRRRQYNHSLVEEERRPIPISVSARERPPAEPLVPERRSILHDAETLRPSFDALFDHFFRNFSEIGVPKSGRLEGLNFELVLSPDEALRGGVVPVGVPVFERCGHCGGSGRDWIGTCAACDGQGWLESERIVRIQIPPMTPSGAVFEVPLRGLGIHNLYLRLHVFVGE